MVRPPRLIAAILRRALPRDVREDIAGDLEERLARDAASIGPAAARRRYRTKAATLVAGFVVERIRDRFLAMTRFRISFLDLRLGLRMLARYPVLSIVGTLSLGFAIAIGAAVFAFIHLLLWPTLPLPDGDRIVTVRVMDQATNQQEARTTAEYFRWRAGTSTLTDLGAGRGAVRNLTMGDGAVESVSVGEVTASTFPMTRVAPVMGRALTDDDAAPAAPAVMLIGERLWRERFGGDPAIVGKKLVLSDVPTTVVGVMPAAYRFPSIYEVWQPLKLDPAAQPRTGTTMKMWARLKPGATMEAANAELAGLSATAAAVWPQTHAKLLADVREFAGTADAIDPAARLIIASVNGAIAVLVFLVSGNVALLMFARAATRESEIIVRTALGASRGRLIAQFLAESLVLSGLAAVVGLAIARKGLEWGMGLFTLAANDGRPMPFWFTPALPPISIAYGVGLALFAAVVTGVLPAMKVTRGLSGRLRQTTAGSGGLKFGGVWTVLIVSQIALTVAFPAVMYFVKGDAWRVLAQEASLGVPAEQYLSARLARDSDMTPAQFETAVRKVREALAVAPGVTQLTVADKLPLMWQGHYEIVVDAGGAAPTEGEFGDAYRISVAAVDPAFFATFDAQPLAGRLLTSADYARGPLRAAVVNESFVRRVLGSRNPIGRRVRFTKTESGVGTRPEAGDQAPWIEIVGLVRNLAMAPSRDPKEAGLYIPIDLQAVSSVAVGARVTGDMTAAASALRTISYRADPTLRVLEVMPLDQVVAGSLQQTSFWVRLLGAVSLSTLMLALSGIYAVMSFAVSRRTREIGIRVALGSSSSRVVFTILRRSLIQVAAGVLVGSMITFVIGGTGNVTPASVFVLVGYAVVMLAVCLLASIAPVRRAMRVDPIAALRAE